MATVTQLTLKLTLPRLEYDVQMINAIGIRAIFSL